MSGELAERFVSLAGPDLLESIEWQMSELDSRRLSAPSTVRDVLSAMGADRIASSLGLPRSDVWMGLRAFVPRALQLAERGLEA
jgi:hypothetical protein